MGIASEIGKHCFWAGEGRLGVDEPVFFAERREMRSEGLTTPQALDLAKERQSACRVGISKCRQEEPSEQAGKHPHRQEKAGVAVHPAHRVERYPTARHNHMDVRMVAPTPTIP